MNWLERIAARRVMIIARGPSGSGKSTMAKKLAQKYNAPIFSSDDFFMQEGQYVFDEEKLSDAHDWTLLKMQDALESQIPVVIADNTNTQFWEMKPYVLLAQKYGYEVVFEEPDWHPSLKTREGTWDVGFLNQMQQTEDRRAVGKDLPPDVAEKMVDRYEYNPTVARVLQSERSVEETRPPQ